MSDKVYIPRLGMEVDRSVVERVNENITVTNYMLSCGISDSVAKNNASSLGKKVKQYCEAHGIPYGGVQMQNAHGDSYVMKLYPPFVLDMFILPILIKEMEYLDKEIEKYTALIPTLEKQREKFRMLSEMLAYEEKEKEKERKKKTLKVVK